MPATGLAAYLAKKYLNASTPVGDKERDGLPSDFSVRPKKRRKKDKDGGGTTGMVVIADDEDLLLGGDRGRAGNRIDEDEDAPVFDQNVKSAEFRKKKGASNWKAVSPSTVTPGPMESQGEQNDADRILADAAAEAEKRQRDVEVEDAPTIVDVGALEDGVVDNGPRMSSGAKAGLQTAADTARLIEREEREKRAAEKKAKKSRQLAKEQPEEETVYRDATGRRIDVSMKRAEARAAEAEQRRQERKEKEDAMGEVQRAQKEERKRELEEAKFLTLGRSVEDEEMNERLKAEVRWDDPMAAYVASKRTEQRLAQASDGGRGGQAAAKETAQKKRVYQGHAPPNRYGILPGWRWDGVDRGNGFEKEWFQARGRKTRSENMQYQWQMDE